jgi:hypothetical protein
MTTKTIDKLYDYGLAGVLILIFVGFVGLLVKFLHGLLSDLFRQHREDLAYHRTESAGAREAFLQQMRERNEAAKTITAALEESWKKRHEEIVARLERMEQALKGRG